MMVDWLIEEEHYLRYLRGRARILSLEYRKLHKIARKQQSWIRIPAILLGSSSGVASFGLNTFPHGIQKWISVIVGGTALAVALLNTIEGFLKIAEISSGSLTAARSFEKLCSDIECELSLPISDRQTDGVVFVRDCYMRFQQILDSAPFIEHPRLLLSNTDVHEPDAAGASVVLPQSPTAGPPPHLHAPPMFARGARMDSALTTDPSPTHARDQGRRRTRTVYMPPRYRSVWDPSTFARFLSQDRDLSSPNDSRRQIHLDVLMSPRPSSLEVETTLVPMPTLRPSPDTTREGGGEGGD